MRAYRKTAWAMVMALCVAAMPLRAAEPEVLKQIPQNADVVVLIPSLSGLDAKIAKFSATLGLTEPQLQKPLESIKLMLNLSEGLDDGGSAAVIVSNVPAPGAAGEPDMVMLLPITDYTKFAGNFGVTAGAGVTPVEWQAQRGFLKQAGKFAVLSNSQTAAEKYATPSQSAVLSLSGALGSEAVLSGDAVVFVDLTRLAPTLRPLAQLGALQMKQELANNPQAAPAIPMFDTMLAAVDAVLRDAQSAVFSLDISDEGLGVSLTVQFRADSDLAKQFAKAPPREPAFNRLPNKPYLLAWSSNTSTVPYMQWVEAFMNSMPKDLPGLEGFGAMMTSSVEAMKAMGDESQALWLAPNLGTGALFNMIQVYPSKDPKAALASYKKVLDQLNNLKLGEGMSYQASYESNVMQVEGYGVDQFKTRMTLPPEQTAALGPAAAFFGQDMTGYAVATKDAALFASGADPVTLKEAILAASGQAPGLEADKGIADIRPKLMKHRFMETYVGVGTIINLANGLLQLFAPEMVIEAPADLPPIATSMSVAEGGLGMRLYVPMPVVTTARKAYDKFSGVGTAGSFTPEPQAPPAAPDSPFVTTLSDEDFAVKAEQSSKPVLVDFWAVWCGPCKVQAPIVNEVAEQYKDRIVVGKLDIDENNDTADKYEVDAIPTLLILKDGKVFKKFVGVTPKDQIEAALNEALK